MIVSKMVIDDEIEVKSKETTVIIEFISNNDIIALSIPKARLTEMINKLKEAEQNGEN